MTMTTLTILNHNEIAAVSGGSAPPIKKLELQVVLPQDMYGNTMSRDDWDIWTAREHDPANGDSIHDFPGGPGQ
jgi:hypothetical protein